MFGSLFNFSRVLILYVLFFIGVSTGLLASAFTLSLKDVRKTMEEMFAYHVENRHFSSLVIRRSFKIYIQQFDPDYLYFLKEEVEPFFSLTDQKVIEVKEEYLKDQFILYEQLNRLIQKAIIRSRNIRQKQIEGIIERGFESLMSELTKEAHDYASSLKELEERICSRLIRELRFALKGRGIIEVPREMTKKILEFRKKKAHLRENPYLFQEEESRDHYLALHILKALAKSLDPHSGYYSPEEAYEIRANLKKEFSGIGVVLQENFDGVFVKNLIQGGPADRSGKIEIGDHLVGLNHLSIEGKSFDEVLEMMKGKSGSLLVLSLEKRGGKTRLDVDLIREKMIMNDDRLSFETEPFADGIIGKIRMPGFYDNRGDVSAEKDLREALQTLRGNGKVYGIILDLRENSGGFLTQAIKVSSLFISGGIIVVSKYSDGEVGYAHDVNGHCCYDGPFVILMSKASASASEIVAAALQDHGVALIVGDERSYGKGSMQYQTLTDENADAFFKVTVGRYYTASGRSPQINGVKSDILIPTLFCSYNIGERYLQYPIANDHLDGEIFHSLLKIKKGSFRNRPLFSVPYLKPYPSLWRQMIGQLRENSQKRLAADQNFQFFLKIADGYRPKNKGFKSYRESRESNCGVDDLQMKEAVEIIKDMFFMNQ